MGAYLGPDGGADALSVTSRSSPASHRETAGAVTIPRAFAPHPSPPLLVLVLVLRILYSSPSSNISCQVSFITSLSRCRLCKHPSRPRLSCLLFPLSTTFTLPQQTITLFSISWPLLLCRPVIAILFCGVLNSPVPRWRRLLLISSAPEVVIVPPCYRLSSSNILSLSSRLLF